MDLAWTDERTHLTVKNVGLITSSGPNGQNIMSAEWTHQVSYSPGLIAVCIGPGKATVENIRATKEFGVSIASTELAGLASIAGSNSGKEINKIKALEELGFKFYKAKKIKTIMAEGAVLNLECKLVKEITLGDHIMFVGEVVEIAAKPEKKTLAYTRKTYGEVTFNVTKPAEADRKKIAVVLEKYKK